MRRGIRRDNLVEFDDFPAYVADQVIDYLLGVRVERCKCIVFHIELSADAFIYSADDLTHLLHPGALRKEEAFVQRKQDGREQETEILDKCIDLQPTTIFTMFSEADFRSILAALTRLAQLAALIHQNPQLLTSPQQFTGYEVLAKAFEIKLI